MYTAITITHMSLWVTFIMVNSQYVTTKHAMLLSTRPVSFQWNRARCTSVTLQSPDQEKMGKQVSLSLDLTADSDVDRDDVTSGGRLFHVFAAVMGKAPAPMIRSRVGGTTNAEVDDERRHCRPENTLDVNCFVAK